MKYKTINNSLNDIIHPIETVLKNRGIQNWEQYLNLNSSVVQDYNKLANMNVAVKCFVKHFEQRDKIVVMPDEDCDGYTSSAMLYLYIKALDETYPVEYVMHTRPKSHGLANNDYCIPADAKLFIIADAATNDATQCNALIDNGLDIIVLDHHNDNYSEESEDEAFNYQTAAHNRAIIVNNQLSLDYLNKDLSGAGIVYRFLQALDEELWVEYADNFLDLCAVGNIADIMDIRSLETRYFIEQGIKRFSNKLLQTLFEEQEFSTKGVLNIHNIAWYISPVINSVTRMGSPEERELLFRAMIEQYEEFDYKKKNGTIIKENIYQRASRLSKNVKSRQDKQRDLVFNELKDSVNPNDKIVILESKKAQSGLVGLSAMKLADTIKRPVIILKLIEKNGRPFLSGSCRNFDNSPIKDFRQLILQTKAFDFCSGHDNAAGVGIIPENLNIAKDVLNQLVQNIDFDCSILCDFIMDIDDLNVGLIQAIDQAQWIWGKGLQEPVLAIQNIFLTRKDITVQGKNNDSVTFEVEGIRFVQFKLKDGDPLFDFMNEWNFDDNEEILLDVVGTCNINTYEGVSTPQFIIEDCNLFKTMMECEET